MARNSRRPAPIDPDSDTDAAEGPPQSISDNVPRTVIGKAAQPGPRRTTQRRGRTLTKHSSLDQIFSKALESNRTVAGPHLDSGFSVSSTKLAQVSSASAQSSMSAATSIEDVETHGDPNYRPTSPNAPSLSDIPLNTTATSRLPYWATAKKWVPRHPSPAPAVNVPPASQPSKATRDHIDAIHEGLGIPVGQCAVTLEDWPSVHTDLAHVIPRSTKVKVVRRIEWGYGMSPASFNHNTHVNIFRLNAALHKSFDGNLWCLLPVFGSPLEDKMKTYLNVLEQVVKAQRRPPHWRNVCSDVQYEYSVVALNDRTWTIQRLKDPENFEHETVRFPFHGLIVKSHVHPFTVIFNAIMKIRNSTPDPASLRQKIEKRYHVSLKTYFDIVDIWMKGGKLPSEFTSAGSRPASKPPSTVIPEGSGYRLRSRTKSQSKAPVVRSEPAQASRPMTRSQSKKEATARSAPTTLAAGSGKGKRY